MRGPATVPVVLTLSLALSLALGCATVPERPATGSAAPASPVASAPDGGPASLTGSTGTPAGFGEVDALLAQSLPAWGGGVLRVEQDDAVIFERAYGGYTAADAVPSASATKVLSVLVILGLVRDGFLTLDTPVGTLVPNWPKDKAAITLRMLLAQTSGLPARSDCLENRNTTLAACTQEISKVPLRAAPGKAFVDGGSGFQVAGRMAELASGKPWALLIQTRLMDPLGLQKTGFGRTDNPRIAGGAQASAAEYARALRQLLPGAKPDLVGPTLREVMIADQSGGVPLMQSAFGLAPGRESLRAGFGVYRDRVASDGRALEVVAQGVYGFTGWVDTERRVVGVLVVHGKVSDVWPVEQSVRELVRKAVPVANR